MKDLLQFAIKPQNMHPAYRWVELSRPLKRQQDNYALDPTCLQLRVMYYVNGLTLLSDEITRCVLKYAISKSHFA
jgi:hypothetical protein